MLTCNKLLFCLLCNFAELKIQAMMLTPNGLLNPKASMPPPPPPPLPLITHTAATPIINSSQSRRASGASTDINSLEQRTPVSPVHINIVLVLLENQLTVTSRLSSAARVIISVSKSYKRFTAIIDFSSRKKKSASFSSE